MQILLVQNNGHVVRRQSPPAMSDLEIRSGGFKVLPQIFLPTVATVLDPSFPGL
jgi:hypothetical protein